MCSLPYTVNGWFGTMILHFPLFPIVFISESIYISFESRTVMPVCLPYTFIFFYSTCTVYNNNSFGASSCLTGVSKNPCNFPSSFILNMVSIISLSSSGNSLCNSLYASSSIFIRIHIFLLSSPIENLLKHWSVTFRSQPFVLVHKRLFFLTPI